MKKTVDKYQQYCTKSLITSLAINNPALAGTKAVLPGILCEESFGLIGSSFE